MTMFDFPCMQGRLNSCRTVSIETASGSPSEALWDEMVHKHHYLGYKKLLGHRLKYIAFIEEKPVAALSWSAAARKLYVRDQFIGRDETQRRQNLHHAVNNSRFLIPPRVKIHNLASHVLSKNIKRLSQDWIDRFGFPLWMLETFVDPQRFHGTLYKAGNWPMTGKTAGFGKQGAGYVHHGCEKEVYAYISDHNFRKQIGCKAKPCRFCSRPPLNEKKMEELKMILRDIDWHPGTEASLDLNADEVSSVASRTDQLS